MILFCTEEEAKTQGGSVACWWSELGNVRGKVSFSAFCILCKTRKLFEESYETVSDFFFFFGQPFFYEYVPPSRVSTLLLWWHLSCCLCISLFVCFPSPSPLPSPLHCTGRSLKAGAFLFIPESPVPSTTPSTSYQSVNAVERGWMVRWMDEWMDG